MAHENLGRDAGIGLGGRVATDLLEGRKRHLAWPARDPHLRDSIGGVEALSRVLFVRSDSIGDVEGLSRGLSLFNPDLIPI